MAAKSCGWVFRPVQNISLTGTITTIHNNSGLVKRCNGCKSLLYDDSCPNKCDQGWGWDLRVSSRLYDGSGSIKMVLTKDIASRILQRNLSELILLATQTKFAPENYTENRFLSSSVYQIKVPDNVDVVEAVTESPSSYRKSDKLIVSDGRNLVFTAPNEQHYFVEFSKRSLRYPASSNGDQTVKATQGSNSASKTFTVTSGPINSTTTTASSPNLSDKMILPDVFG